jgi:hypothetical protein
MTATSASGGYLTPAAAPLTQDQLVAALHGAVSGITGLAAGLIRPRWQPKPPKQPDHDVTWCSLGVAGRAMPGSPAMIHDGAGEGATTAIAWERLRVLVSVYGPDAQDTVQRLIAGLGVAQNRDQLRQAGLAYVSAGDPLTVPELINTLWVQRVDLELIFDHEARRTYPVRNLLCGSATIETDTGLAAQSTPTEEGA